MLDDVAVADLEPHRVGDIAAIGQDHDVAGLEHHGALRAALVRERVDVAAAPVVEMPALVGDSPTGSSPGYSPHDHVRSVPASLVTRTACVLR